MGRKRSKRKNKDTNNNINYTSEQLEELRLLSLQEQADITGIVADLLSYASTRAGFQIVDDNARNINDQYDVARADILAIQSLYLTIFARIVYTQIGFTRYENLYEKYINGEIDYSLQPDMDINTGNIIRMISNYYLLRGTLGIYERDSNQPIFGV
ncbi:MAG: hypothetical protein RR620_06790 [Clostridium sp.]